MAEIFDFMDEASKRLSNLIEREPSLKSGDGGGTSGGMEPRIAKLEAHMEHVRDDLASLKDVPVDIATLNERVSHLPTKG